MKVARFLPWLGGAAAALLLVNVNVLGARWYQRWDVTTEKLYSLSTPTRELLRGLPETVDVIVLLSKGDPLLVSVRHMLEAYGAETQKLRVVVVPEVSAGGASLAYAAINPAIALGAFLAQLILSRPVAAANTREFHITGTWDDPKVEKVEAPAAKAASAP